MSTNELPLIVPLDTLIPSVPFVPALPCGPCGPVAPKPLRSSVVPSYVRSLPLNDIVGLFCTSV